MRGVEGLPADNFADTDEYVRAVYARPDFISTLATSTPISDHVKVDFELRGCPETTVIILFWIISGLCAVLGLGIFYGDFLKIAKVV